MFLTYKHEHSNEAIFPLVHLFEAPDTCVNLIHTSTDILELSYRPVDMLPCLQQKRNNRTQKILNVQR